VFHYCNAQPPADECCNAVFDAVKGLVDFCEAHSSPLVGALLAAILAPEAAVTRHPTQMNGLTARTPTRGQRPRP
jgi:hypothetical protein